MHYTWSLPHLWTLGEDTWGRYRFCKGSSKQSWIRKWKSSLYTVVIRNLRDFGSSSPLHRCINPLSLMVESVAIISLRLEHKDPIELNVSSSTREPARLILVRRGKFWKNLMKKPGWIEVQEVKSRLSRLWHFSWSEMAIKMIVGSNWTSDTGQILQKRDVQLYKI